MKRCSPHIISPSCTDNSRIKKNDDSWFNILPVGCVHPFSICIQSKLSSGQDSEADVKSSMDSVGDPGMTAVTISGF